MLSDATYNIDLILRVAQLENDGNSKPVLTSEDILAIREALDIIIAENPALRARLDDVMSGQLARIENMLQYKADLDIADFTDAEDGVRLLIKRHDQLRARLDEAERVMGRLISVNQFGHVMVTTDWEVTQAAAAWLAGEGQEGEFGNRPETCGGNV